MAMLLWYVSLSAELHQTWLQRLANPRPYPPYPLGGSYPEYPPRQSFEYPYYQQQQISFCFRFCSKIFGTGSFWVKFLKAVIEKASLLGINIWICGVCWWSGTRIGLSRLETAERNPSSDTSLRFCTEFELVNFCLLESKGQMPWTSMNPKVSLIFQLRIVA